MFERNKYVKSWRGKRLLEDWNIQELSKQEAQKSHVQLSYRIAVLETGEQIEGIGKRADKFEKLVIYGRKILIVA